MSSVPNYLITIEENGFWKSYKEWMRRNRPACRLLEDSLSRVLLYVAPRGSSSSGGDGVEVGYAILHIWSLSNDLLVLEDGGLWGGGNGMTVGHWNHDMIPLLRLGLSLLEYIAPAIEVVSRRKGADHDALLHLERFKIILRTLLLLYNYATTTTTSSSDGSGNNGKRITLQRSLLEDGGMLFLNNHNQVLSREEEQLHFEKLSYRGKRTGQPCCATPSSQLHQRRQSTSTGTTTMSQKDTTIFHNVIQKYRWLLADLLHIIRPYYWTLACRNYHHHHHQLNNTIPYSPTLRQDEVPSSLNDQPLDIHSTSSSFSLWKAYLSSLAMDLLSQKIASSGGPIISQSTYHELLRRKRRLWFYILRTPLWDTATLPILSQFIRLVQSSTYPKVIWRFILQPIVDYVMDTLHYYQSHHFMLE